MNRVETAANLYKTAIEQGDISGAVKRYVGQDYKQHSSGVKDGIDGFAEFFTNFIARYPKREINIVRSFEDAGMAFLQVHQNLNDNEAEWVTFDFFAFDKDDKVVEHWDVIAPYSSSTPSGHTSTDGPTDIDLSYDKETSKEIVRNLIQDVLIPGGDKSKIDEYISAEQYLQHNKEVADGLAAFKPLALMENGPLAYKRIVHILACGNFVVTLCEAAWEGAPYAQADLFRIEDGKIVEHWDAAEAILPESEWVNSGKF